MVGVMIVPTGLGCSIGGHAGDATPAARLIASVCDQLIVNPNVVNASDLCEMSPNMVYVDGLMIDRFLSGIIDLKQVYSNHIVVAVNPPISPVTRNAVAATRIALGADIEIIELETPLIMTAVFTTKGRATGKVSGVTELIDQISDYQQADALAIHTPIEIEKGVADLYFREGGINPWGGVEAIASRLIGKELKIPVAHAPIEMPEKIDPALTDLLYRLIDPRMAPEVISNCFLHCVLKGLHKAPVQRKKDDRMHCLTASDIDFLISPNGCWGLPHQACLDKGIEIIVVKDNRCKVFTSFDKPVTRASTYLEAAGIISARKAGVTLDSTRSR